jgi:hypothetical protein
MRLMVGVITVEHNGYITVWPCWMTAGWTGPELVHHCMSATREQIHEDRLPVPCVQTSDGCISVNFALGSDRKLTTAGQHPDVLSVTNLSVPSAPMDRPSELGTFAQSAWFFMGVTTRLPGHHCFFKSWLTRTKISRCGIADVAGGYIMTFIHRKVNRILAIFVFQA